METTELLSRNVGQGYINAVFHEPLFQVLHNACLRDLLKQDHVVHTAGLNIVTLPVVLGLEAQKSDSFVSSFDTASMLRLKLKKFSL